MSHLKVTSACINVNFVAVVTAVRQKLIIIYFLN